MKWLRERRAARLTSDAEALQRQLQDHMAALLIALRGAQLADEHAAACHQVVATCTGKVEAIVARLEGVVAQLKAAGLGLPESLAEAVSETAHQLELIRALPRTIVLPGAAPAAGRES